jgi:hypothetical protein
MRFNDLLRTVLANMGEGTGATVTRWRQCIDLIAQYDISGTRTGPSLTDGERAVILDMIDGMRPDIAADQRIASIVELGPRLRSAGLVRLLSNDHPTLVSAMIAQVRLSDADWADIIPHLGPLARSVLRRRTDLGSGAAAILRQFGSTDMTLPLVPLELTDIVEMPSISLVADDVADHGAGRDEEAAQAEETSQIGRIVARIERFTEARAHRQEDDGPIPAEPFVRAPPAPAPVNEFLFETDGAGHIQLVSGAPRGAAVGLSIGMPSVDSRLGADGMALGAFRRRAAFENARFAIGDGQLEGEWRISAEPRFDRASGRFLGYTGSARREFPHEGLVRTPSAEQPGWAGLSAGSTRQLIHELRTPLNAIQGYAEMIEAQLVGPVTDDYRAMARNILSDAHVLLATFDDLDLASRIERGDYPANPERIDLVGLIHMIVDTFGPEGSQRVDLIVEADLPRTGGDRAQIERMISHLIRAGCAALRDGERLTLRLGANPSGTAVELAMLRPEALRDLAAQDLLDHGYLVDQKLRDAPPLGLAFTLKLVRGIANHVGGAFTLAPDAFGLVLPTMPATDSEQEGLR